MEVIFLGTGTSQGVPMIACRCGVCRSSDARNRRTRTSIHVVMDGLHIQVDAGQEFRLQCLDNGIEHVDLFLLTHGHADHVVGMDDLRRFCDVRGGEALPVYSSPEGLQRVREIYPYALGEEPVVRGYPLFRTLPMPPCLEVKQGTISATPLPHGRIDVLGLVFRERSSGARFAYYTDCKSIGPEALRLARGADVVVLDALRPEPHPTHMSIDEAVETARVLGAPRTYLTHFSHGVEHATLEESLPASIRPAFDGLRIEL